MTLSPKPIFLSAFLLLSTNVTAQIVGKEYSKIKSIERSASTHDQIAFELILDTEKDLLAIGFDLKPTVFEVYKMSNWNRLATFEVKGFAVEERCFFSHDGNKLYVHTSKSRHGYLADLQTGSVTKVKLKDLTDGPSRFSVPNQYVKYWKQTPPMDEYFYFDNYLLEITNTTIVVYRKEAD